MHVMGIAGPAASATPLERALPFLVALMFLIAPLANPPLLAQGLESEGAIDAIIGSDVKTEEAANEEEAERVVAAIENTLSSAESVRKTFSLDTLEIVFLPEDTETGPIGEAIDEHREEIEALRESIEGSAMFYHAVDSRSIMLRDIVAVEFGEENVVTIFVNGSER
ncbi:hypothetical protein [Chelativorans salis]|uniref:Uncharacterized protein n=1 Tax=Chelativorans salis TaxID=2978478 RepID=A0ABT2LPB2_9HYPH|nr:hypothetical protein [Chelativorans sp. EGI FJ00035]MCT7376141.1 hypothetical protein [Chelativorans sp. EGI FJ00035]